MPTTQATGPEDLIASTGVSSQTVFQRGIGFGRNVLVCRLMDPQDLGLWNLAETTLILFAPLLVLGVPGTLSRYVEHYRQRSQLRAFLKRVSSLSVGLAVPL